jgi:hypothetical protein
MVGFAAPDSPTIYERVTRVALVHIGAMEDLAAPAVRPDEGQA